MEIEPENYVMYDRKNHSQSIKNKLTLLKEEGKFLGRPHQLQESTITEVLDLLEKGVTYRSIAKQCNLSHGTVAKIKKEGLTYLKRMQDRKQSILHKEDNQYLIRSMTYAKRLQIQLYLECGLDLKIKTCYEMMKDILSESEDDEDNYEYFEYKPPDNGYVELTNHSLKGEGN
jgi:hypothetical protein